MHCKSIYGCLYDKKIGLKGTVRKVSKCGVFSGPYLDTFHTVGVKAEESVYTPWKDQ